jgi:hypothetical protein
MMRRFFSAALGVGALIVVGILVSTTAAFADTLPSGEVTVGQTVIEPAYNIGTGGIIYLSTPKHAVVHPNSHQVAPLYLPVYPRDSLVGTLNCQDFPVENCPDHGPLIAGLAQAEVPGVYGEGVLGHDHLGGVASSHTDFNVNWEPVVVLFTSPAAVQHITTLSQLESALAHEEVKEIRLPAATFHCAIVSGAVYARGTPLA